ncbi:LysM peptidoglycan-binding domain-containing protein [Solitalea canadensis]|uniref:LysM domain-containing protein n=1 Tax=Solitalea canadensis (strain ATCC 29591 / DSM 3403 / JCM 21819 / LMG 8368 / NBRC 15130 / NCIMB 12057 / USAM 9D) TaxID=929556 RepID=H8KUV1_SOLCM|nr:LysM peptidoglycan-binding domain-containing protein [Solitalea canadensis]AFD07651.1 LysM domain-containing protein [Solitalea canadensis DSM 3403]
MYYKIKAADSLSKISKKFSIPVDLILSFNKQIKNPDHIYAGQLIFIPNLDDIPDDGKLVKPMKINKLLERAGSATGKKIKYKLGKGGMKPGAPLPASDSNECDCSGFVCWVLGLSRKSDIPFYKQHGGWIYTDSMVADVNSQSGIFEKITIPEEGCIVVYGAGSGIGHVGIVSEVEDGTMIKVIHCSSGNYKKHNDSILETGPDIFNRADSLWGRFALPI